MIVRIMMLIAIMTILVLPPAHDGIIHLIMRAPHLMPQVIILPMTQLQFALELVLLSLPTIACCAPTWLTTVDHEVSTECFSCMSVQDILLQHATTKVQGVFLAQLTAYAVNDNIEIVVEVPCEGIG
jgi:hypothetical protein